MSGDRGSLERTFSNGGYCNFCGLKCDSHECYKCSTLNPIAKELSIDIQRGLHDFLPGCYFGPDDVYRLIVSNYKIMCAIEYAGSMMADFQSIVWDSIYNDKK